ncbi:MAG TPA: undecaprenyl-diphosphatase [Rheinheimera sp.]|uniref:undecaprenyl-diphosphate phosphatase n=1 Tax=Rheinheimera sp. TaxID=1869214 RepID=UPI000EEA2272|nr:undecaprenyl-diphosphate phosphatase [Rheinheimera sp.]HCU66819.1 undecaprenyl-diphosphatase [Rheinheimera sp.]
MDWWLLFQAFILGIVEGLTEFLPVSSTGHLIVVADLIGFHNDGRVFEIAIQFGAILAIVFEYRQRFLGVATGMFSDSKAQKFILNLFIAFLPAAIIGLLFIKTIKLYLFNPITVAVMLVLGGLIILWAERRQHQVRVLDVDDISWKDALKIGCAQVVSMVPGTSRSGATIIGGLFIGLDRKVAAEFSFFLAVPTMFAATFYDLFKHRDLLGAADIPMFAVGFVTAFVAALLAVRTLVKYVGNHSYEIFAWYRIAFGGFILLSWQLGWIDWATAAF